MTKAPDESRMNDERPPGKLPEFDRLAAVVGAGLAFVLGYCVMGANTPEFSPYRTTPIPAKSLVPMAICMIVVSVLLLLTGIIIFRRSRAASLASFFIGFGVVALIEGICFGIVKK